MSDPNGFSENTERTGYCSVSIKRQNIASECSYFPVVGISAVKLFKNGDKKYREKNSLRTHGAAYA